MRGLRIEGVAPPGDVGDRQLCRWCFAPALVDPATMQRVTAEIGRCVVCGLEAATWHGGRIRVESAPGEGSTFFFTLPAA